MISAGITVNVTYYEGSCEWGGGDFNVKLEAGRQAQIRPSARDK